MFGKRRSGKRPYAAPTATNTMRDQILLDHIINLTDQGRQLCKRPDGSWPTLVLPDELYAKVRFGGMERITPKPSNRVSNESVGESGPTGSTTPFEDDSGPSDLTGNPLFIKLRAMRAAWAKEAGQSAFTIFPNKTLEALVRERPSTPFELAAIKGVGPVIRERYGAKILEAVAGTSKSTTAPAPARRGATRSSAHSMPTHQRSRCAS